jgi:hypothetical protein
VQEIVKSRGRAEYYMSIWDWAELEECRSLVFPSLAACDVRSRYEQWGGLPRYVLEKTSYIDQQALSRAINRSSIRLVREAAFWSSPNPRVSDLLLHTAVADDFVTTRMEWASAWVFEKFFEKALLEGMENLVSLLRVARGPERGSLRGRLWEGLCHGALARGGNFSVRSLYPLKKDKKEKMTIKPCDITHVYDDLSEVRAFNATAYLRPSGQQQAAIDSIRQPSSLYQITTSTTHDVKPEGLRKAMDVMTGRRGVTLYFVVPEDSYPSFSVKNISTLIGQIERGQLPRVSLRVLEIRYDQLC